MCLDYLYSTAVLVRMLLYRAASVNVGEVSALLTARWPALRQKMPMILVHMITSTDTCLYCASVSMYGATTADPCATLTDIISQWIYELWSHILVVSSSCDTRVIMWRLSLGISRGQFVDIFLWNFTSKKPCWFWLYFTDTFFVQLRYVGVIFVPVVG